MSHQARVRSNCPQALPNTSICTNEAWPLGRNLLPGHPENQDQELQASQDSQALWLIPEREQRGGGEGVAEQEVDTTAKTCLTTARRLYGDCLLLV